MYKVFYHGGVESDFNYDKLDLLRPSEKQGNKYAGFYMYGEENFEGAIRYANQENNLKGTTSKGVERITLDSDLNIYEEKSFGKITRLEKEYLESLQKQGYDVVSGKMMGKTEYVLLNKNKIRSMEFIPSDNSEPIQIYSRDINNSKETTTVTIEDNNEGVKTETTSTNDTIIPNSSENQNNAENIKQEQPITPGKNKPKEYGLEDWYKQYTQSSDNVISQRIDSNRARIINEITSNEISKGFTGHISQPVKLSDLTQKEKDLFRAYETELQKIGYELDSNIVEYGKGAGVQRKIVPTKNAVTNLQQMHEKLFEGRKYNIGDYERKPQFLTNSSNNENPDNLSNKINKEEKPKQQTKPNNSNTQSQIVSENISEPEPKTVSEQPKKPKVTKGPKINSSNITKEQIEKVAKETGMKVKKLTDDATKAIGEGINWNKVGKVGAIAGAVALVGFGIHNHNKKEKENRKNGPDRLTGATRKSEFWNQSYTAQMAKDISTYQYGKRMTGFVQG